jgi:hypothetical protein
MILPKSYLHAPVLKAFGPFTLLDDEARFVPKARSREIVHTRLPHGLTLIVLLILASFLRFGGIARAQEMSKHAPAETMTDSQVIEELAASTYKPADAAVDEILRRGVRMIPLLIKTKGDKRLFSGFLARSSGTATIVFTPSGDPKQDKRRLKEGKFVTVEVAALYLITAIHYDSLNIAQSPYLTDFSLPEMERTKENTKKLVERAWKATAGWYQRLTASNITALRAANDYPLSTGDVSFW